jgi:hypothetical protein
MARSTGYSVGSVPPQVTWTVVRGDTAAFRVYVADDQKSPVNIPDWTISAKIKRPATAGVIEDSATLILNIEPAATDQDGAGEFTVSLAADESQILETGDVFDVQLSDLTRVWTVCQGSMVIIEDVTD